MMTARDLLAAVRAAQGLPSNYALARAFDIPERSLQRWNTGTHVPDDATAARLAELAGFDPDAVVAAMHAQRAHDPAERSRWERIAGRLGAVAAAVCCAILAVWTSADPSAWAPSGEAIVAVVDSAVDRSIHWRIFAAACAALLAVPLARLFTGRRRPAHWPMSGLTAA